MVKGRLTRSDVISGSRGGFPGKRIPATHRRIPRSEALVSTANEVRIVGPERGMDDGISDGQHGSAGSSAQPASLSLSLEDQSPVRPRRQSSTVLRDGNRLRTSRHAGPERLPDPVGPALQRRTRPIAAASVDRCRPAHSRGVIDQTFIKTTSDADGRHAARERSVLGEGSSTSTGRRPDDDRRERRERRRRRSLPSADLPLIDGAVGDARMQRSPMDRRSTAAATLTNVGVTPLDARHVRR